MRSSAPFGPDDLAELDALLLAGRSVVPARDARFGGDVVLRHDVDDNAGSFECALRLARWEHERGYSSTYYLLHTASYWRSPGFARGVALLEELGHEVGIHGDAVALALLTRATPAGVLAAEIQYLRDCGAHVTGFAAHGNALCRHDGRLMFVNDEMFSDCPRPECGEPDRLVAVPGAPYATKLTPAPLALFGLEYAVERLPYGWKLSDSGGIWSRSWGDWGDGQLHLLMHPDWWVNAV